jgi:hypothetical protein
MDEIKKKFHIKKISAKNIFLVVLVMVIMVAVSILAKAIGKSPAGVKIANTAQACWDVSACAGEGNCDSSEGSEGCEGSDAATTQF